MKEEFENTLRGLKSNKAPEVNLIAAKLLQNLGQAEKNLLFKFVCDLYETGVISNDFNVNKTVTTNSGKSRSRQMREQPYCQSDDTCV